MHYKSKFVAQSDSSTNCKTQACIYAELYTIFINYTVLKKDLFINRYFLFCIIFHPKVWQQDFLLILITPKCCEARETQQKREKSRITNRPVCQNKSHHRESEEHILSTQGKCELDKKEGREERLENQLIFLDRKRKSKFNKRRMRHALSRESRVREEVVKIVKGLCGWEEKKKREHEVGRWGGR